MAMRANEPRLPLDDLVRRRGPSSSTYAYDEAGRLASWDNGTATTQYAYDGTGT
ncbi:MAG: hypothetical protein ACRDP7_12625 [Trebonia sp.]